MRNLEHELVRIKGVPSLLFLHLHAFFLGDALVFRAGASSVFARVGNEADVYDIRQSYFWSNRGGKGLGLSVCLRLLRGHFWFVDLSRA